MSTAEIRHLEERIAELRRRIPPHSVPPSMLQELEDLEEKLEQAEKQESTG
jgi:uncharacterized membrane protein